MQNRIVEIATDDVHISLHRGFLKVQRNGDLLGQVAIEDMAGLIIRGYGASLTANLCARLSEENVPVVICSANQSPASVIWPVSGHFTQGLHMQAQAVANKPLQKRLWARLVTAKVEAQAQVLEACTLNANDLFSLAKQIKSGDSENIEAQAARRYWPRLMGSDFIRGSRVGGVNGALNYGYTVLRAATARSILAAGLHPSLSIHHQSRGDALRLADDLMEPFRPWVDLHVYRLTRHLEEPDRYTLDQEGKASLAAILTMDLQGPQGASPIQICLDRLAQSLVQVYLGERKKLELPRPPLPLTLAEQG